MTRGQYMMTNWKQGTLMGAHGFQLVLPRMAHLNSSRFNVDRTEISVASRNAMNCMVM